MICCKKLPIEDSDNGTNYGESLARIAGNVGLQGSAANLTQRLNFLDPDEELGTLERGGL